MNEIITNSFHFVLKYRSIIFRLKCYSFFDMISTAMTKQAYRAEVIYTRTFPGITEMYVNCWRNRHWTQQYWRNYHFKTSLPAAHAQKTAVRSRRFVRLLLLTSRASRSKRIASVKLHRHNRRDLTPEVIFHCQKPSKWPHVLTQFNSFLTRDYERINCDSLQ